MKKNYNEIVDLSKLKTLLDSERLTLINHPTYPEFLASFIKEYEFNKSYALRLFSNLGPNGEHIRETVAALDLSNIKNEVLAVIIMFIIKSSEYNYDDCVGLFSFADWIAKKNKKYDPKSEYNNDVISKRNPLGKDLINNMSVANSIFERYLDEKEDVTSFYIEGYLDTFISFVQSDVTYNFKFIPSSWNNLDSYTPKQQRLILRVLNGKNKQLIGKPNIDTLCEDKNNEFQLLKKRK